LELNETDLGLFHPGRTPSGHNDVLVEGNALDELSVFNSTADLFDDADISQIDVRGSWGNETTDGLYCDRSEGGGILRDDLTMPLEISITQMTSEVTFELSEVVAARSKAALSSKSIGTDISVRYSTAFAEALKNDSAITVGWIPLLSIFSAAPSRLPARTTTEVVPSPASMSCAADRSTSYIKYVPSITSDEVAFILARRTILAAG
jgi:hypothetical protein